MAFKPELLAAAGSPDEVRLYVEAGADALTIGNSRYGMRLPGDFTIEQIEEAVRYAHQHDARIYVVMNNIMDNLTVPELPGYIRQMADIGVDALVFGDPAVLVAMKQAGCTLPLHWNPEMTATNYVTANYWATKGATRFVLARELNMEQVLEIKRHADIQVQVQIHGMTNIYHSKRNLVKNYFVHQGKQVEGEIVSSERGLFLVEAERPDERFPIYEDKTGTHIMSSDDLCMLENIDEFLEAEIDSLKIEVLLKPREYNEAVIRSYRSAIDAYTANPDNYEFQQEWLDAIVQLQPKERPLSFGFFYKEQVY